MLMPPPPNHGDYYITLGLEWGMNFENTKNLAKELGITVPIDEKKEPIAPLGTMFWFRPRAMKLLLTETGNMKIFHLNQMQLMEHYCMQLKEYIVMLFNRKVIIRHGLYLINVQI